MNLDIPRLRTNPFYTYRDPETGQWITVLPRSAAQPQQLQPQRPKRVEIEELSQLPRLHHSFC